MIDTHIETFLLVSHDTQLTKSHMPVTSKSTSKTRQFSYPFLFLFLLALSRQCVNLTGPGIRLFA